MAPTRTEKAAHRNAPPSSTPAAGPSNPQTRSFPKPQKKRSQLSGDDAVPGVQKIKAALRQTRRFLAKDKLAADVRVATERRLKALEANLAKAERIKKERAFAMRYHKIKFFERQKVTRKIQQLKRKLIHADKSNLPGKDERRLLEEQLLELRVDFNYILHYPRMKKYISLFPPEIRAEGDPTSKAHMKQEEIKSNTDAQRDEIRTWVRSQMESGEMDAEPELEVPHEHGGERTKVPTKRKMGEIVEESNKKTKLKTLLKDKDKENHKGKSGVAEDDFFGNDSDGEEENAGGELDDDDQGGSESSESEGSEDEATEDDSS